MKVTVELDIWQMEIMNEITRMKFNNYGAGNPFKLYDNSTEYDIQLAIDKFFAAIPDLSDNLTEKLTEEIKEELEDERQADRDDIESEIKEEIFYNIGYPIKKIKEILKKKKLGRKKIKALRDLINDIKSEIT